MFVTGPDLPTPYCKKLYTAIEFLNGHSQGQQQFQEGGATFISLSCDSSPQSGVDFQMTLEDQIKRSDCCNVVQGIDSEMEANQGVRTKEWDPKLITTTVLPVSTMGAMNVDLAAKYEVILAALKH